MCIGGPSPPAPPPLTPEAPVAPEIESAETQSDLDRRRAAGSSTLLTSSQGVNQGQTSTKTLLGE